MGSSIHATLDMNCAAGRRTPELLAQARQQPALKVRDGVVRGDAREAGAADEEGLGAVQADAAAGRGGARGQRAHSGSARPRQVRGGAAEERDAQRPYRAPAERPRLMFNIEWR